VGLITPFNFPIEIPVLQYLGALYMGNAPLTKPCYRVGFPMEQWIRMLHYCGLPMEDSAFFYANNGQVMEDMLKKGNARTTVFTGSSKVAEKLCKTLNGKIRIEDAGFDWKILGPDVPKDAKDKLAVAWQCDHDAYGLSGQKCSATSILFVHKNWAKTDLYENMRKQRDRRSLNDLTISPTLSITNETFKAHMDAVMQLEGAELMWGGKPLTGHSIPSVHGCYEPTAVKVPIKHFKKKRTRELLTTELFAPF
jgi:1-pyrroline-5-carboxylate dehydrogenase